jgi:hypothetical protein
MSDLPALFGLVEKKLEEKKITKTNKCMFGFNFGVVRIDSGYI